MSLGVLKKLAIIEFEVNLAVGTDPQDKYIIAAKKVLKASEYSGMKVVKFRVNRFDPNENGARRMEKLDFVVA